jgi:hypothetical protein
VGSPRMRCAPKRSADSPQVGPTHAGFTSMAFREGSFIADSAFQDRPLLVACSAPN